MPYLSARRVAGTESTASLAFVITLDEPSSNEVSVRYALDNGSAVYSGSGADFRAQSGTLIFAPGETSKTINVAIVDNGVAEDTEVFWLDLNAAVNATVKQRWTPAFLFDDDGTSGTPVLVVSAPVVDESAGRADFFVWLSQRSAGPVSVSYTTVDDTAQAGSDYVGKSGVLTFAPGERVQTVSVDLINDAVAEGAERFGLQLSGAVGANIVLPVALAEIGASDAPAVGAPYVTARPAVASEGDTASQFVVSLSAPSNNEVRVNFSLDAGSAQYSGSGADFRAYSGTLVFAPGETTHVIPFLLVDDSAREGAETLWLDLSAAANATVLQRWTPGTLYDDDGATGVPVVKASAPVVDEAAGTADIVVSLSRPSSETVSVDYRTADDTASAGSDYLPRTGRLVFLPGEMAATVRIDLVDDADAEGLEHFAFVLSNPQGATVPEPSARVTIAPSDGPTLGAPYVFARAAAAGEADGWMDVTIGLSAPSPNEVRVNYGFDAGSAVYSGSARDFSAYSGVLVFPPGQTTHTLRVLIEDNSTPEPTEGFWLDLSAGANAVVGQRWTPLTVVDNDASSGIPAVSVTDAIVDEGAGLASFFVSLSKPATSAVSVGYGTQDGSAVAGADYRAASGTLVFQPGEVVKTVQVEIHDDGLAEADERFHLSLGSPNGLTVGDGIGVGWIGRSDGQSVSRPSVSALPVVASEADGRLEFIVQLSAASGNEVRVNFSFDAGTALYSDSSADFRAYSGTLVYAPGETTKSLTVLLVDDTVSEGDEVFSLDLGSAVNAIVPQRYVQATILDDDGASTVFSGGRGDDLYRVSNALDQITESPRGGIDTVISSISYTLPENVENLVLSGSALNALGNGGDNVFRGTSADNLFDGKGGVDTVVFSGPRAAYAVSGTVASRTVTSALDGRDTLLSIERLQFTDVLVAEDTSPGGNVWLAYAMLNAAFDTAPDTTTLSRWTAWLDREGGSADALAQAMINFYAPGVPDDVLVQHLWGTIVEAPLPLDALATYVGLVRDGTYTQAGLLSMVTTLDLNTVEIAGIVGQPLVLDPAWFPPPGA